MPSTDRLKISSLPLAIAIAITCFSLPAQAGGLYVGEFGQPTQGASRAGATALAEDASTARMNPAGIMFLDGSKSMATGIIIDSSIKFKQDETFPTTGTAVANAAGDGAASNGGDAGSTLVGGAYFYANPVNDKWGWGVALTSISGAVLDYGSTADDFAGRYWANDVDLLTLNLMPSLSYKLRDDLSIAVSLPITYGSLDMDVAIPGPAPGVPPTGEGVAKINDGDDLNVSIGLSTLWQANDSLRLGLIYQSKIEMDFDSDLRITPPDGVPVSAVDANVEFTYPQTIRASAAQDINDELTFLASVAWEDWSALDELLITTPAGGEGINRNWRDTWFFSVGLRWQQSARWTYYTGIGYDTDPIKDSDRTTDMPMDEQWRYSGGVTYERDNGHKIGGVLTYADYGDADIDNGGKRPGTGDDWTVKGYHSTNRLIFLGLNYGW
jgi:long-chain fatty acid transport protein